MHCLYFNSEDKHALSAHHRLIRTLLAHPCPDKQSAWHQSPLVAFDFETISFVM